MCQSNGQRRASLGLAFCVVHPITPQAIIVPPYAVTHRAVNVIASMMMFFISVPSVWCGDVAPVPSMSLGYSMLMWGARGLSLAMELFDAPDADA